MTFDEKLDALRADREVLVDGPHHSQRRTVARLRSAVPGSMERHFDAVTFEPVSTFDATVSPMGTVTVVYLPPAPPQTAAGAWVPTVR